MVISYTFLKHRRTQEINRYKKKVREEDFTPTDKACDAFIRALPDWAVVRDNYQMISYIKSGSYAKVFKRVRRDTGQTVAIKAGFDAN